MPYQHRHQTSCLVFAYGSNLFEARMVARIPSARVLAPAVLPGHDLRFHMRSTDGSGKADAHFTNAPIDQVAGVVYRIEPGELSVLDHYEGGYSRRLHPFHLQGRTNGQPTPAWTYHARPERIDPRLRPFDWYHRFVVEGAQSHRIAPGHVQRLKQVQVIRTGGGPPHPLL